MYRDRISVDDFSGLSKKKTGVEPPKEISIFGQMKENFSKKLL